MKDFIALIIQMGHEQRTSLKSYWCTDESISFPKE
jgi:hypothetical protein